MLRKLHVFVKSCNIYQRTKANKRDERISCQNNIEYKLRKTVNIKHIPKVLKVSNIY